MQRSRVFRRIDVGAGMIFLFAIELAVLAVNWAMNIRSSGRIGEELML